MVSAPREKIVILTGPTAVGKTGLALQLASAATKLDIEIINADSLLVYRGFDIGTAKPTTEELKQTVHHLVNIREPDEPFTAGDFVRETEAKIAEIKSRRKRALIVGGTGFYLKALLFGLWEGPKSDPALREQLEKIPSSELYRELFEADEEAALRIGGNDRYRLLRSVEIMRLSGNVTPSALEKDKRQSQPNPLFELWIVDRNNDELFETIQKRTRTMLTQGFVEEVESLLKTHPDSAALKAVGYAQVVDYLTQKRPPGRKPKQGLEGLAEEIDLATRQLVKKQRTWFKAMLKQANAEQFTLDRDVEKIRSKFREIY